MESNMKTASKASVSYYFFLI